MILAARGVSAEWIAEVAIALMAAYHASMMAGCAARAVLPRLARAIGETGLQGGHLLRMAGLGLTAGAIATVTGETLGRLAARVLLGAKFPHLDGLLVPAFAMAVPLASAYSMLQLCIAAGRPGLVVAGALAIASACLLGFIAPPNVLDTSQFLWAMLWWAVAAGGIASAGMAWLVMRSRDTEGRE
jgi:hypothetical protein